jgi:hypothetical protein
VFKKRCHFLNIFFLYVILPQSERAARERKGEKGQMARESFHLVDPKPDTMGLGRHPQIGSCISKALPPHQTRGQLCWANNVAEGDTLIFSLQ